LLQNGREEIIFPYPTNPVSAGKGRNGPTKRGETISGKGSVGK